MPKLKILLCAWPLMFAPVVPAAAHTAEQGETCGDVQHNVTHKIQNQNYSCDKTVCSKCSTSGGTISGCTQTTYWENCVAAARGGGTGMRPPASGGVLEPPGAPPKTRPPTATPPSAPTAR
jgi:hypothetical protein